MFLRLSALVLCLTLTAPIALAQDDPELGDTGAAPSAARGASKKKAKKAAAPEPAPEPAPAATTSMDGNTWGVAASSTPSPQGTEPARSPSDWERPPGSASAEESDESKGDSDHEKVVGHLGVGLLGLAEVPVGVGDPRGPVSGSRQIDNRVTAPVLGARYWFSKRIGLELGVGFMLQSGKVKQSDTGASSNNAKATAFAGHVGLPISAFYGKHYNFLLIPYVAFGTSSATDTRGTAGNTDDVFGKGTLIEGGLRAGVEVQLGAIGLEGFALQLAMGVRLRLEHRSANAPTLDNTGKFISAADTTTDTTAFGTSQGSTLGSAIAGSLAAVYYF